jgi:hypothetical protein
MRSAELADYFLWDIPSENELPKIPVLVLSMRSGKTNQFGKLQYAAMARCRNVWTCPVGSIGLYVLNNRPSSF